MTAVSSETARNLLASKLRSPNESNGRLDSSSSSSSSSNAAATPRMPPAPSSAGPAPSLAPRQTQGADTTMPLPSASSSANTSSISSGSGASSSTAGASPSAKKPSLTPQLAPVQTSPDQFAAPTKRILSPVHLARFESSQTFADILAFVKQCNEAVVGRRISDEMDCSEAVQALLSILDSIAETCASTPPESGTASRFGNPAFRTFYVRVREASPELHSRLPGLPPRAVDELRTYFEESWGNESRIDYGSGMELNFALWLICLVKVGVLSLSRDAPALVLRVFWRYVGVMRQLQSTYWLEPAGSHGVWGLDDYHFLPFLWGSGQLRDHKHLRPKSIHDKEIVDEFSKDFMYLACIQFINSIKTASLRWHSPMLDDISGVKTWSKVNEGMLKMYRAEVLLKLPIAQHIFFGSLLPFPPAPEGSDEAEDERANAQEDEHRHVHSHGHAAHGTGEGQAAGWGDCCGIPIPSVFAAAQEERERSRQGSSVAQGDRRGAIATSGQVRRIPFD